MKIAFDYQIFANQKYGGISRYFANLARNIARIASNETDIRVVAPFHKNNYLRESVGRMAVIGLKVPDLPRTGRILRCANNLTSPYLLNNFNPDLIHETYYSGTVLGSASTKRVITVYDMIHELFHKSFPVHDLTSKKKKKAVARADHIVCISNNTRNDLLNILEVDESKVSVVHLGFELPDTGLSVRSLGGRKYFLFVGARGGYKNFESVVRAYAASPKILKNLDFVCFGGGSFSSKEVRLFEEQKIPFERIRQVSGDDVLLSQYYSNALFFVYPSLYEGFGIPPLEAMSYGCPVACSDTSSIPEVVGDAAIQFDPYSFESIADSLEKLFLDSSMRESLIIRGFERIKRYSWEKCAAETLNIYKEVLS